MNVFAYEDETPYCIYNFKKTFEKHIDLLLLSNFKNSHYVLIKDLDRFMTNKIKHHSNKNFVDIASIAWFSGSKVLECLVKNCLAIIQNQFYFLKKINTLIFKF